MAETPRSVELVYVDEYQNQIPIYPKTTMENVMAGYGKTLDNAISTGYLSKNNLPLSEVDGGTGNSSGYIRTGQRSGSSIGSNATAEGYDTTASGEDSHAEGLSTLASGLTSHAEGYYTTASGNYSHAEGYYATASGENSHAEGYDTTASGEYSHAEGYQTTASGNRSHAEGCLTTSSGKRAHAEGYSTEASGEYGSHSEGYQTTAFGKSSHASGYCTLASSDYQFVCGKYNDNLSTNAFEIGWGTSSSRKNIFSVSTSGDINTSQGMIYPSKWNVINLGANFQMQYAYNTFANNADNANIVYYVSSLGTGSNVTSLPTYDIDSWKLESALPPYDDSSYDRHKSIPLYLKVDFIDTTRKNIRIVATTPAPRNFYGEYWYGYYSNGIWLGFVPASTFKCNVADTNKTKNISISALNQYVMVRNGYDPRIDFPVAGYYMIDITWRLKIDANKGGVVELSHALSSVPEVWNDGTRDSLVTDEEFDVVARSDTHTIIKKIHQIKEVVNNEADYWDFTNSNSPVYHSETEGINTYRAWMCYFIYTTFPLTVSNISLDVYRI